MISDKQNKKLEEECSDFNVELLEIAADKSDDRKAELIAREYFEKQGYSVGWVRGDCLLVTMMAATYDVLLKYEPLHKQLAGSGHEYDNLIYFENACAHFMQGHYDELLDSMEKASDGKVLANLRSFTENPRFMEFHSQLDVDFYFRFWRTFPRKTLLEIAEILVRNAFDYRAGWPDLLLMRNDEIRFVEVKAKDHLLDTQQNIIRTFMNPLKLDFCVAHVFHEEGAEENKAPEEFLAIESDGTLSAELSFVPVFNLALQQNALPVVYELKLVNHTGRDLDHLEGMFSSDSGVVLPKTVSVEPLKAGEELSLHDLDIKLDYKMLASLSEPLKGTLSLEIKEGGQSLLTQKHPVEAFAADQWLGLDILPELLCSFVTPNQEAVNHLESLVSSELENATGSPSVEGYQADKTRVYEICAAVYRAIHSWGIRYSNPAASFGTPGQRIRFADSIYQYRLGTCLDTTLLFASVMEQCGLHPVIMLQKGHAYIGCHLVDRYFPDIPMDDLQMIRKLADLDEFLVIETTMVTGNSTFAEAEAAARSKHLNVDADFHCAIDVIRARYSGIRPLPLKRSADGIEFVPVERDAEALGEERKRLLREDVDLSNYQETRSQSDRVARWTQKLLDLSLRNRLLNVRDTKQVIPIACSDIAVLEDKIAADESLSLNPLSGLLGEKDLHDIAMLRTGEVKNEIKTLLDRELGQRRLWTMLSPVEMARRLTGLYRQSRTDLEEGGVNTLFLAVGFLEWKMTERDPKSYSAPILLIPVRLQRKSIVEGIRISRIDEDTVVNVTLLELLRREFHLTVPGLDPLPTDDSGVDVGRVMQIFRQTTKDMKGWEVREEARIGHFSFGKFIMWNDLTARIDALKQNPLVDHLIEGGGSFDDGVGVFPPSEIGKHLDLKNLYCPMSADSSQLTAVLYSQTGKNFVLHGPPGTGKSQTITNIIAHNLAWGRRVLFVSEKKAALEVVHKRLSSIGLRPFCLELHSNKSGKKEVLEQFSEALAVPETGTSGEWQTVTAATEKVRDELNEYVSVLHDAYPNGLSAYRCFSRLLKEGLEIPDGLLQIDCLKQSAEELDEAKQLVSDLANSWIGTTPEAIWALSRVDGAEWTPVFEKGMLAAAQSLLQSCSELIRCYQEQSSWLGLEGACSVKDVYNTAVLAEALKHICDIPAVFLSDDFSGQMAFLVKFRTVALRHSELEEKLRNYHLETLAELDLGGIETRIRNNNQTFILLRFFKHNALLKELAGIKKLGGGKLKLDELIRLLPDAGEFISVDREYRQNLAKAESLLGRWWNNGAPDWDALKHLFEQTQNLLELVGNAAAGNSSVRKQCLAKLQAVLPDAAKNFSRESQARKTINAFLLAWNEFQEKLQAFTEYAKNIQTENDLSKLADEIRTFIDRSGELRGVLRYRKIREAADARGLRTLAEALEAGTVAAERMPRTFETAYCKEMLDQVLATSPVLCNFTGLNQEERIRKFCELDGKYTDLSKRIIFAKLASALPRRRSGPCPEGTELGILKRECEKRARQKPVRQLLEQIPTLAPILKPCFLMSPLSVAQYLPPDSAPFDLIVFDEASQIPVWDAIGVIARGKQLIVVGDPKQMPPTNFFQKGETEDDNTSPDIVEDMESILDECLAAGVHSAYLNWHYRSRHESLISFSNHYYYDDKLFTFPAARKSDRLGVSFEFVPGGIYDRKATRTNRKEAETLVDYVFAKLENPKSKKRSIGIVTFSQAQKDLIEDLMEQRRAKFPQLEAFFTDQQEEPLFVKNLENVQGDERDVILFSICYAPDTEGKFSMNFGPLNRQGGERRLNVAITRAKEQVVVFSSVHATQIELSRTNATGAAHLKYFLDYAEKGFRIQNKSEGTSSTEGLTETIAAFLTEKGFPVERNVGSSGYRIDLAVRNPAKNADFLMAIECDGLSYASQKTTRDRDHLRDSVLHSLGWHTYRAWSVDWAFDRKRAEENLLGTIERVQQAPAEPFAEARPKIEETAEELRVTNPEPVKSPVSEHRKVYSAWDGTSGQPQEAFYEIGSRDLIRNQMHEVIQEEAPIYESLLRKRIVKAWGFNRTGDNIQNILAACLPNDLETTKIGEDRVFWACGQSASTCSDYRVPKDEGTKRGIDEIPPEELANAMYEVLMDFNSCEQDTLYRETVKRFGLSAVTAKARKYLEFGMQALKQSGRI